jgi:hypothetical protein
MPYPPQKTYQQTTPETALDPQRNAIAGGTGNAHTIPGTTPGQLAALAMKPYNTGSGYDLTLTGTTPFGREIVGTSWSATASPVINDANGNGTGFDTGDTLVSWYFTNVVINGPGPISSATLYVPVASVSVPSVLKIHGESNASAPTTANFDNASRRPSLVTRLGTTASSALISGAGNVSVDVTAVVNAIIAGAQWAAGNSINLIGECATANGNVTFSNEAGGTHRLVIVQ